MNLEHTIWVEKYRPNSISEYVFSDPQQKLQIEQWIAKQDIPHILLSGSPGTGKSTLAKVLINELHIDPYDVLWINASRERNIDTMRDSITNFVTTMPFGDKRIVVLDEADGLNPLSAQPALRGIMEQYAASSRFILTCNYPGKILPAIHSRTQAVQINKLDVTEFTVRLAEILLQENVEFDPDILDDYVTGTWPDLRKAINNCQQNSIDGKLLGRDSGMQTIRDYKIDAISLFKSGDLKAARKLICSQIRPEELEDFFRFLYDNLDLWGSTDEQKDAAILLIKKNLALIPMVADAEILVCATLIELSQIS